MICKYCKTENEDWQEYCFKCHKPLKPVEYKMSTKVLLIISIVIGFLVTVMNSLAIVRNFNKLSISAVVYVVSFSILILLSTVGLIVLFTKRKRGFIIYIVPTLVNLIYSIIMGESPLQLLILFLPAIIAIVSMSDMIKKMDF